MNGEQFLNLHACGVESIDSEHAEFIECAALLRSAWGAAVGTAVRKVQAHCESHFAHEELLMRTHSYPVMDCHVTEHEAVLKSIVEVRGLWDQDGEELVVHRLADALIDWLEGHVQHLDSAVAAWVVQRTRGGHPLVLRRQVAHAVEA
jgi:hemerythrin